MVDISGHVAIGLLWALPAWFLWRERVALAFVAVTAVAALVPDVDLWLEQIVPSMVHHHGVTHTVVFALAVAAAVAALAAWLLADRIDARFDAESVTREETFGFAFAAVTVGILSHIFGDLLSAPDIAQPIEPFWPIYQEPIVVDVIWYDAFAWNFGLLFVAIVLHGVVAYAVDVGDEGPDLEADRHH